MSLYSVNLDEHFGMVGFFQIGGKVISFDVKRDF